MADRRLLLAWAPMRQSTASFIGVVLASASCSQVEEPRALSVEEAVAAGVGWNARMEDISPEELQRLRALGYAR